MVPQALERLLVSLNYLNLNEGIIAVAKHLYGHGNHKNMILELNASDDRGINVVREQIKSFCSTQQLMSKGIKLVILDECDSMTQVAQFALRRGKT